MPNFDKYMYQQLYTVIILAFCTEMYLLMKMLYCLCRGAYITVFSVL